MMCLDCNKVRQFPIIERKSNMLVCPVCFGSFITHVDKDAEEFARTQKWYYDKPEGVSTMSTSQEDFEQQPKELETITAEDVGKAEDVLGDLL